MTSPPAIRRSTRCRVRHRLARPATAASGALFGLLCSLEPLHAQVQLLPARSATVGPVYERWSFGAGLRQPTIDGAGTVELRGASAWSVPLGATIGLSERWTIDLSGAYSNGTVHLRTPDPVLKRDRYSLSGFTDVRARLTGRIVGDNVIATLGANLPSGTTSLDPEQFAALRVLAAPVLGLQTPALGTGPGATAGVVLARQIEAWAWALGASYELRRTYTPIAFAAGATAPDVDPGDALHLSLGGDGLVGQSGMTLALTADFFTDDRLKANAPAAGSGSAPAPAAVTTHLGPIFTVDWQLRIATPRLRELTVYAVDRYRTSYERAGRRVPESSGNYADAGVRAVFPLAPSTGVLASLNVRHHTGLKSDSALATAATAGIGTTVGLVRALGGGYSVQPFVRAEYANITSADASVGGSGISAGVGLGRRF